MAQEDTYLELKFSNNKLEIGQDFLISIEVHNPKTVISPSFPEINGLNKGQMSTSQQTRVYNGKHNSSYVYLQRYTCYKAGVFQLKPFKVSLGNLKTAHKGMDIIVTAPEGFEDNNFLEYKVSKSKTSLGESFRLELCMWYETSTSNNLQFSNQASAQLDKIKKYLKSKAIWIEEMPKSDLKNRVVNGKTFSGVRLFDYVVTPQNSGVFIFDNAQISLTKKIRSSNGSRVIEKIYESNQAKVEVLTLPSHSKNKIAVLGDYQLEFNLDKEKANTGEELTLEINVFGEGNLPFLTEPRFASNDSLIIVQKDEKLELDLTKGVVKGKKLFSYSIIPQIPGQYNLSDYFGVFNYNFKTKEYKSLVVNETIDIKGENLFSVEENQVSTNEIDGGAWRIIQISPENGVLRSIILPQQLNIVTNVLLLLIFALLVFMLVRHRNKKLE